MVCAHTIVHHMPRCVHHEAHEGTKKGKVKGGYTTEDTEGTEKGWIKVGRSGDRVLYGTVRHRGVAGML